MDPARSLDGVYQLSWSRAGGARVEESRSADFADPRVVYEGRDLATTLSGRPDGIYYYRVVASGGELDPSSASVRVEVAHHPLSRALGFFAVGFIVFASTVALVIRGDRDVTRSAPDGDGSPTHE